MFDLENSWKRVDSDKFEIKAFHTFTGIHVQDKLNILDCAVFNGLLISLEVKAKCLYFSLLGGGRFLNITLYSLHATGIYQHKRLYYMSNLRCPMEGPTHEWHT